MPRQCHPERSHRGLRWSWSRLAALGLSVGLVGCGDEEAPSPQVPKAGYPAAAYQPPAPTPSYHRPYGVPMAPQHPQWGMQGQQPAIPAAGWQQPTAPTQAHLQPAPASPAGLPPADNPWRRPPAGFGAMAQAPQSMWQQAQPAMPQFRPLEQARHGEYRSGPMPLVAPYDRPMGSSQDRQQPGWPAAYPAQPGYPGYPGMAPGYWPGAPVPWGWPGAAGMWPGW